MNAFIEVVAYVTLGAASFFIGVSLALTFIIKRNKSRNDIEVERLKSNVPIYPWSEAPDWAVCAATDGGDCSFWYGAADIEMLNDPMLNIEMWRGVGPCVDVRNFTLPAHINWKDSKEMRP